MYYWLLKTEGECYSIDDLKRDAKTAWTGIRNYQARNYMRDGMHIGDLALFYHSGANAGIYGIAKIVSKSYPDLTQFDKKDDHFDPKATKTKPIWQCVDIAFVKKFKQPLLLSQIKFDSALEGMVVRARGSRLSVQPVLENHFTYIKNLAK
ncbi:EVE domain-containing protein [Candidatus Nomurabacteria bacterium]|jgi:predicted RNA-binding protein with PUA-like domain|nr:MAG: EVE domain-containing protein [Candidatus Nomurabacteria bacterium]